MARALLRAFVIASVPLLVVACNAIVGNEERELVANPDAMALSGEGGSRGEAGVLTPIDGSGPGSDAATDAPADAPPGDAEAGTTCPGAAHCIRTVFVTSVTRNGNIGGVEAADNLCQTLANSSGNLAIAGKQFAAWLSTGASHAPDRLVHGTAAYHRIDGTPVANNFSDLIDNNGISNPISLDEKNAQQAGPVWTAINASGTRSETRCNEWTHPSSGGFLGQQGIATEVGVKWTDDGEHDCSDQARIYCFEK